MIIQEDKYNLFYELFATQFKKAHDLWSDCALIAAFLDNCELFDHVFMVHGDKVFENTYEKISSEKTSEKKEANRISRSFVELMKEQGFSEQFHNVTFTGNNSVFFIPTLQAGILFKDMVGSIHGRYAHTVQWYGICLLHKSKLGLNNHDFKYKPGEIYRRIALYSSEGDFPGEVANGESKKGKKTLWDFCVDCFRSGDGAQRGQESLKENLYSNTYRSPSVLTESLTRGKLSNTSLGKSMRAGINKHADKRTTSKYQSAAKLAARTKEKLMFDTRSQQWVEPDQKFANDGIWVGNNNNIQTKFKTAKELDSYRNLSEKL